MKTKICHICKIRKLSSDFYKSTKSVDKLQYICIICDKKRGKLYRKYHKKEDAKRQKRWYEKNKTKVANRLKLYEIKNKERIAKRKQRYYIKNKKRIRKVHTKYMNKQRKININLRFVENLRRRMNILIHYDRKSTYKLNLIGCTISFLKQYLTSKFTKGMSWDNYGKWHIDHIKPCASFDISKPEEQRKCFHYTNLQPLWAVDNLKKHDKFES